MPCSDSTVMMGPGQVSWRTIGGEVAALGMAAASMPLRWFVSDEHLDRAADEPPVVFVHGLFGDPTNFLALRGALRGRSFSSFSYLPRLDYQRLAGRLRDGIERVCAETGAPRVDLVGHSLGGFVGRHLVESTGGLLVRRLVTLGAPYSRNPFLPNELAIFAGQDGLVTAPDPRERPSEQLRVVPDCGHVALLYHPAVLDEVVSYLGRSAEASIDRLAA